MMIDKHAERSGSTAIIAIVVVAVIVVVLALVFIRGNDDSTPAETPADETSDLTFSIPNPNFDIVATRYAQGDDHVVATLDIANYEDGPVLIQCIHEASDQSGQNWTTDIGFYALQPGQNRLLGEVFSNTKPSAFDPLSGGSAIDPVGDFDNLIFRFLGGEDYCMPLWVLESFDADASDNAIQVVNYNPAAARAGYEEFRYRPSIPETCSYRLESSDIRRDAIDGPWSDYGDSPDGGVTFGITGDTHILARNCGQWQRVDS